MSGGLGRRARKLAGLGLAGNLAATALALALGTGAAGPAVAGTGPRSDVVIPPPVQLSSPVTGAALTPDGSGVWLVSRDGGVITDGDAPFLGSAGGMHLSAPIVAAAATPDGKGYWLFGSDGGVMTYGDAGFFGSAGGMHLSAPIVAAAATPDGQGYWLVGRDGGVMTYGDAGFFGSAGGMHLSAPIVAAAATPDGHGYWLVGSDGGVMTYGDAGFFGSAGGMHLAAPIVAAAATPDGHGYWLVGRDGGVMTYGDAPFLGTGTGYGPVSAIASSPALPGYVVAAANGTVVSLGGSTATTTVSSGVSGALGPPQQSPSVPIGTTPTTDPSGAGTPSTPTSSTPTTAPTTSTAPVTSTDGWSPTSTDPGYTFLYPDGSGGTQARWNPCASIRYAINLTDAPTGALADTQQAVADVSAATGISFEYVGTTTFVPNPNGSANQFPSGIDAVIAWVGSSQFAANSGEAGLGGNWWESSGGPEKIFEGYALLNGDLARSVLKPGFSQGYSDGHLLLHELGHMMGLGHTQDPREVMVPIQGSTAAGAYGPGDLAGLKILGSGGCL